MAIDQNAWTAVMATLHALRIRVEDLGSETLGKISSEEDAAYGACKETVLEIINSKIEEVQGWAKE